MVRKTNLGFTLIELLAVIVILGIIMVITTPVVIDIIDEVRKGAFKTSVLGISKTSEMEIAKNILKDNKTSITFTYENGFESSIPEGYKLNYKGTKPQSGIVVVSKTGKVGIALHNGRWCALKGFDEIEVILEDLNKDECINLIRPLTITLNGSAKEYVEINTSYEDSGVVVKTIEGEIIKDIQTEIRFNNEVQQTIDVTKLGTYEIIYKAEYEGYIVTTKREVIVQDTMPPELTIPPNVTITTGEISSYDFMSGVSVVDNSLEEIQVNISSDLSILPGEYGVVYSAKDSSGNETIKTRYITVIDVGYPVITIVGLNPVNINMGSIYTDLGATAIDDVDGDITSNIVTTGTINTNVPGTYIITYTVEDSSKNKTTVTRTVNVIDTVPPTITFGTNGSTTYAKSGSTSVVISDNVGVDASSLRYLWNTSTTAPTEASFANSFTNNGIVVSPAGITGGYYLWILAKDVAGNTRILRSNVFNLDSTSPAITSVTSNTTNITPNSFIITRSGNATDAHSGLATNPYIYQISTNGSTWTTKCTNNTTSCNVTGLTEGTTYYYRICVNDILGNQSCIGNKTIATTLSDYSVAKGVNRPQLVTGMTPIKWNGTSWVNTTEIDTDWYDYSQKKWANAKTADGSYWVWIPRYAYQISSGYHTTTAGNINIKFLQAKTNTASDGTTVATTPTYSGSSQTNYIKHPAFNFGGEILGFWVAKFEPSGTSSNISIIPNATSLREMSVKDQYSAALNMKNDSKFGWLSNQVDTHMMKNLEWGAVAYLSKSVYGANAQIWINNSNTYTTGCAGASVSATSYSGCQNAYNTTTGWKASTTHNIYGVYDMSGGTHEYVMGNLNRNTVNSGFTQTELNAIDIKYIDIYAGYNNSIFGDALYETSSTTLATKFSTAISLSDSWFLGRSTFVGYFEVTATRFASAYWFVRGDDYNGGTYAGIFSFRSDTGVATSYTFRPVAVIP